MCSLSALLSTVFNDLSCMAISSIKAELTLGVLLGKLDLFVYSFLHQPSSCIGNQFSYNVEHFGIIYKEVSIFFGKLKGCSKKEESTLC